ncbi:MAG: 50S ribosomal protein L17 [Deltaproteobacteria bacterium RIFCSPLOWO2_12_FULL_40_28]|nr:MAG: 50S ribosomal protein L17 [Deltaproteobacteria bacterium RIFCSPHIGHO2_02_FULL_40_28]OGQ18983.1 MAG: 50S ribosomal protein L17 [Deltaproteobacteria bacterium RIFCSPHIGHO2_12_FULL_40_32]OGQ39526.1 MAG: 50S ribosomal protein L17 [Deltaproteobacteria bacterium RIFCSPLOWO2_02_FULL_40_36]OGQ53416.1 MAG: 50S ribosomal protein L17 [Deltaproteobacteria bacterium RIFCSPLOWO2_12_FULL_40_28]
MRHQVSGRKLGRTTSHRWALFRNMVNSLVDKESIRTTLHKAKELRRFADRMITIGKKNDLSAKREAFNFLRSETIVKKIFDELAPRFKDRHGGYTRIVKLGYRPGDAAAMALIQYLPGEGAAKAKAKGEPTSPKEPKIKAKVEKKEKAKKTTAKKEPKEKTKKDKKKAK